MTCDKHHSLLRRDHKANDSVCNRVRYFSGKASLASPWCRQSASVLEQMRLRKKVNYHCTSVAKTAICSLEHSLKRHVS